LDITTTTWFILHDCALLPTFTRYFPC